jgi:hypothetical protein
MSSVIRGLTLKYITLVTVPLIAVNWFVYEEFYLLGYNAV